jgi:hypothetical protein
MADFAKHLKNRGHEMTQVETMMLEAAKRIDNGGESNSKKQKELQEKNDTKILYLHWQYHPWGITKNAIWKAYNALYRVGN